MVDYEMLERRTHVFNLWTNGNSETMCSRLSSYKGWDKAELSRGSNPRDVGWCWWGRGRKWKGDDQSDERDIEDDEETILDDKDE